MRYASHQALFHRYIFAITPPARVLSRNKRKEQSFRRFSTRFGFREYLQKDFKSWIKGEFLFISLFLLCGVSGVYIYTNRENTPVKRVEKLLSHAKECADRDERQKALHDCLQSLTIIQETNPQGEALYSSQNALINPLDRHLFSVAFGIAAQDETLGNRYAAVRHYLEALQSTEFLSDSDEKVKSKVVTMDRIAQCYEELGEFTAAEKYYRQAIQLYQTLKRPASGLDQEIPGVVYNYGHFLWKGGRLEEAQEYLTKAKGLAMKANLAQGYGDKIQDTLTRVMDEQSRNNSQ
uniref:Uncharacterized protein AlNc14C24G2402 n=1 Tax=Albugo laibachii Nc14 TaxID=890382 RepID=F0W6A2_9STRA|nr:conserved hypothetical protein [Albugo laibachii Nc14]|eukprot:CCA16645.1 conserved hypothetical protein [Albugo laibachii Nc14]